MGDSLIVLLLYGSVFVNFVLSIVILERALRNIHNFLFGLITFTVAVWAFAIAGFYSLKPIFGDPSFWIHLSHSSALLVAMLFLYFTVSFPTVLLKTYRWFFVPFIPFAAVTYSIFYSTYIIGETIDGSYEINTGYVFYGLLVMLFFFAGYIFLFKQYAKVKTDPTQRRQVIYVLLGTTISSLLGTSTNLVLPYFGVFNYTWLGPLFTLFLIISIFTAIFRYHLFNIKVIATELLTFGIWIALLIIVFVVDSLKERLLAVGLLLFVVVLGIFTIRSVIREVSQREQIERLAQNLEKANKRLKELDRLKSEFVSIASHQLRSPLTAIKGYASLILEGSFGKANEAVTEAVQKIFDSSSLMAVSVQDFLDVSRIEQGKMKYNFEVFDLAKLLKTVFEELTPVAQQKKLEFNVRVDDAETYMINADLGKIKQVLYNLIDNSIKYTPTGSVTIVMCKKEGKVNIEIRDTGVGIAPETLPKLFDKFVRSRNAHHVNVSGTGLGLFVVKEMIEAHKGRVWATSDGEGKGSVFHVELDRHNK